MGGLRDEVGAADIQQVVVVVAVAGLVRVADGLASGIGIAQAARCPRVVDVQAGSPLADGEVLEPAESQIPALFEPAAIVRVDRKLTTQVGHQRPVVDRVGVGKAGPVQLLGRVRVTELVGRDGHEPVEAAEQEVQVGLLAGPQPPVQQPVDPVADPACVQEHGKRLA